MTRQRNDPGIIFLFQIPESFQNYLELAKAVFFVLTTRQIKNHHNYSTQMP